MKIEHMHHATLLVSDLDRAKSFYGGVLGLAEIERPPFNFPGAWYDVGGQQIHLIADAKEAPASIKINTGDAHIALRVTDFQDAVAHLEARGVQVVARPKNLTPWPQAYCTDPDGNVIELNAESL